MKVDFRPTHFTRNGKVAAIVSSGVHNGPIVDFLAVMAKLYQMPYLWCTQTVKVSVNFETQMLHLEVEGDKNAVGVETIQVKIPLVDLLEDTAEKLRQDYIVPFAAAVAGKNFDMPKTAEAIEGGKSKEEIAALALEEGHPVLNDEILDLLYGDNFEVETSYKANPRY
jgi:hypothetical protein